jgi:short-subunit dehydrogenase
MINKNLKNKIILITGSNGHIGKYLSNFFYKNQVKTILVDKDLKNKNNFGDYFPCNFENSHEVDFLIKKIKKKYETIDSIINNAAMVGDNFKKKNEDNLKFSILNWKKSLNINLITVYHICLGLENCLRKSKNSSIINISSIYSILGPDKNLYKNTSMINPASYAASKGGLNSLTRWLACTLNNKIRVNTLSLGGIFRNQNRNFLKKYCAKTIIGRMATEKDVVGPIVFLISEGSKYITGQNIVVDGGLSIK